MRRERDKQHSSLFINVPRAAMSSRRIRILLVSSSFAVIVYLLRRRRQRRQLLHPPTLLPLRIRSPFLKQFLPILRILIPRLRSDSFVLLVTHLTTLISRTFLSIYIARLDGAIVKSLVQRNPKEFLRNIAIFLAVAIPGSFINSFIRFAESKLALAFRTKLTRHAYEAYFRVKRFSFLSLLHRFFSFFDLESNVFPCVQSGQSFTHTRSEFNG